MWSAGGAPNSAEQLPACGSDLPGVRAVAERTLVHGKEYLCVRKYSSSFAGEQLHSITTSLSNVLQSMRRLSIDLAKPGCRLKETQIRNKIQRWLSHPFLQDPLRFKLIRAVRPDVLVKGGDYRTEQIVGHEFVLRYGGQVLIVPLLGGH